jgi:hypothetical protein
VTIDLAKNYVAIGNAKNNHSVRPIILRLADDPHFASGCSARKSKCITNNHANLVFQQNADSFSAFAQRRSRELRAAFGSYSLQFLLSCDDLGFTLFCVPAPLCVTWKLL